LQEPESPRGDGIVRPGLLEEDIAAYEGRHDDLIYQAPAFYRLRN